MDDPDFDLEYHVRHIALPQPGDWRKLLAPTALKAARQLAGLPAKLASGVASTLAGGARSAFAPTTRFNGPVSAHRVFEARFHDLADMGPLIGGLNLFHVVASYNGMFSIGATADRKALPDPATYAECMETAFQELLAATG